MDTALTDLRQADAPLPIVTMTLLLLFSLSVYVVGLVSGVLL